uniref:Uncharacterized protein n=1 Tax=Meloidogyne javanica TaxID=6303 RepID=A0A915MZE7_MELJA
MVLEEEFNELANLEEFARIDEQTICDAIACDFETECGNGKEKADEEPSSPRKVEESGGRSRGRGRGRITGGRRPPITGEGMSEHARAEEGIVGHGMAGEQLNIRPMRVKHKSSDMPPSFRREYFKQLAAAQNKGKGIQFNEGGIPMRVKEMPQTQGKGKGKGKPTFERMSSFRASYSPSSKTSKEYGLPPLHPATTQRIDSRNSRTSNIDIPDEEQPSSEEENEADED